MSDASEQPSTNKPGNLFLIFGVLAVILLCILGPTFSSCSADDKPDVGSSTGAYVVCKQFMEDRLKAPSTADFASMSNSDVEKLSSTSWEVTSYVDAQNSFGAMVRTYYVCKVSYQGDDNWRLVSLTTD